MPLDDLHRREQQERQDKETQVLQHRGRVHITEVAEAVQVEPLRLE